jgi:predicted metalloendopeptidase
LIEAHRFIMLLPRDVPLLTLIQVWCSKTGEKSQRLSVRTDQHAPSRVRVNAGLSNMPEFAEAFSCPVGSAMNPADKCSVW